MPYPATSLAVNTMEGSLWVASPTPRAVPRFSTVRPALTLAWYFLAGMAIFVAYTFQKALRKYERGGII